jgi:hypothetical protein
MSTDRDRTVDDMSEGGFHVPFPIAPARPEWRSRIGAEIKQVRLDQLKLTSLVDQRPRIGWSTPRIVETSDTFLFHKYCIPPKNVYMKKMINTWLLVCFRRSR